MRVLLAIDPNAACGALSLRLSAECIPFDVAAMDDVRDFLLSYDYDIVLLAVQNPAPRLAAMRRAGVGVPVVVVMTADSAARTTLLNLGADDAVSPACEASELIARVRAVVRRNRGHARMDLQAGAAELRLGRMEVVLHGQPVALTPKEYAILELLFLRRGVVHAKPAIVNHVYGAEEGPALRTLDVIVCKLRKKLALHGAPDLVATVWGSGLTLRELPENLPAEAANDAPAGRLSARMLASV
jgi:two-component system cell cycle response regulator CtrA